MTICKASFLVLLSLSACITVQGAVDILLQSEYFDSIHLNRVIDQYENLFAFFEPEVLLRHKLPKKLDATTCGRDLEIFINASLANELWALKTFDSWGKPLPSGILKGNLLWLGNYEECVDGLYQENNRSYVKQPIDTQYCAIHETPTPPVEVRSGFIIGTCVPASCNRLQILEILRENFNLTDFTRENLHCSNDRNNEKNEYLSGTIAFIVVLSILVMIVMVGTLMDLTMLIAEKNKPTQLRKEEYNDLSAEKTGILKLQENTVTNFMMEISIRRTIKRILEIETKKNDNNFGCLDGIRVLSLFWIICGHSFSSGIYYTSNMLDITNSRRNFIMHLINGSHFAVDTFFVMSGFLTTVLFVRQMQKKPITFKSMSLHYIHRYLRLTPSFVLVMFLSIYLTPYFGRGPLYPIQQGLEPKKCRDGNWWSVFLYIGNFLKSEDICNGITWYLYDDMQFYLIAPIALIPFVKGKKVIGYIVPILLFLVSIFSTLGILLRYPRMVKNDPNNPSNETIPNSFDIVYMRPYCRVAPYASGMITGFIISQLGRSYPIKRILLICGNCLAIICGLTCIYSNYGDAFLEDGLSRASRTAHQVLRRPAWGLSISWLIFICSINKGGIVNRFLASPLWSPLVRVNYAAYLIHMIVILITLLNVSVPSYYQFMTCLNSFVAQLFFSYLAAVPVFIFFETPFFFLEKRLLKR